MSYKENPYSRVAPYIPGTVEHRIPDDVHVLPGNRKRAGAEQRQRYADHLSAAYGLGYLDDTEHAARHEYVMNTAESAEELEDVVRDLPPMPRTPPGTRITAATKTPYADALGHPALAGALIAGGIMFSIYTASHLLFTVALMVMVFMIGMLARWARKR